MDNKTASRELRCYMSDQGSRKPSTDTGVITRKYAIYPHFYIQFNYGLNVDNLAVIPAVLFGKISQSEWNKTLKNVHCVLCMSTY